MRKGKQALWAAIGVVALAALVAAATAPARTSAPAAPIKAAWIYVGPHNDGGWSQAHDLGRLYVQKKLGKNVVTTYKENVPEGPQASQVIDSLVRDGNKIIFATSFGYMDAMAAAAKKYPDVYFEHATGYKTAKNFADYFGAGEDAIYLVRHGGGRGDEEGRRRLHRPVPDPGGHPARERLRARRAGDASGREGQARLDEVLVRPGEGEEGGGEPRRGGRRRDRPERRQPGRRAVRAVEGAPVGRLRQRREEVRADLVAHGGRVRLGPVLPEARQGGRRTARGRRAATTATSTDGFTDIAPFGPKVSAKTKAADRGEAGAAHQGHVLRVPGAALRPGGQAPRAEGQADDPAADPHDGLAREGHRSGARRARYLRLARSGRCDYRSRGHGDGRPTRGGRGDARHHEALSRASSRTTTSTFEVARGRGARAARRERRRQDARS